MNVPACEATSFVKITLMVTSKHLPYSLTNVAVLLTYYQAEGIPDRTIARICTILYAISACFTSSTCTFFVLHHHHHVSEVLGVFPVP